MTHMLLLSSHFGLILLAVIIGSLEAGNAGGGVEGSLNMENVAEPLRAEPGKSLEDSIPVIEIRGEGKPMTAAQIRALEEETEGKPLDIKVKNTWVPQKCPRKAKRKDFVTFQYKAYLENGKKFDQTYGRKAIYMQLGVGLTLPGLDKGLKGMCDTELRKLNIPWRLAQKGKSRTWKYIPTEEHWLIFDIEMLKVDPWSPELQFKWFDTNNDTQLTVTEMNKHIDHIRKEFGKKLPNNDIDHLLLAKYFVKYFDRDGDNKVSELEYSAGIKADLAKMKSFRWKPEGRKRDPGITWVIDFNGDGVVDAFELDSAPDIIEKGLDELEKFLKMQKEKHDERKPKGKDEL